MQQLYLGEQVKVRQEQVEGSPIKKSVRGLNLTASGTIKHNNNDLIGANGVIIYFHLGGGSYPMSAIFTKETVYFNWLQYTNGGLTIYIQARFTNDYHFVALSQYSTINDSVKITGYDIF